MIKKIILSLFLILIFTSTTFAQTPETQNRVNLYFFWANGCPHCSNEKVFLKDLAEKYPNLAIKDYEITSNQQNLQILIAAGELLSADVSGVPFTVVGDRFFSGFYTAETTGKEIEEAVLCAAEGKCPDVLASIAAKKNPKKKPQNAPIENINVPFFGELEIKDLSLPVLTFVIAALDGFNPCAMWTLVFLISLLLGMKDRKRMWILGTTFIITSGFVYFLFLSAWLNFFLFLGFVVWVRIIIGIVALGSGSYYLRDYFVNKSGACKVTGNENRRRIFEKLKAITQKKQFIFALSGIIMLAIAVNMVELICSAGLPAIYTKILSNAQLPTLQYYLYLLFYIVVFMLDDLFVFFTAMITLKAVGLEGKYARISHLVGGILMIIIGILMLFRPEWLMFG